MERRDSRLRDGEARVCLVSPSALCNIPDAIGSGYLTVTTPNINPQGELGSKVGSFHNQPTLACCASSTSPALPLHASPSRRGLARVVSCTGDTPS